MATKRFITPFAESGIKAPVSDVPAGTDVNYETGYTPEYALDPVSDPSARFVEITNENQLLNDITGNVKLWQDDNYPEFITAANNGGVAHSYNKNVVVRYGGDLYISTEDGNDTLPTSAKWIPYLPSEIAKYLELKIFQSPTDGLTEINTRTLLGGEVYEVRKVSDDSLATIYIDKEGLTPITQDGTSNVSGSDGVVGFYIADGNYYIEVDAVKSNFLTLYNKAFVTPAMYGLAEGYDAGNADKIEAMIASGHRIKWGRSSYGVNRSLGGGTLPHAIDWESSGCEIFLESSSDHQASVMGYDILPLDHKIEGKLTFNANLKANIGLRLDNLATPNYPIGYGTMEAKGLSAKNVKRILGFDRGAGISITGAYTNVDIKNPTIDNCILGTGAGIEGVVGISGLDVVANQTTGGVSLNTTIRNPHINDITSEDPNYMFDQDGIKCFGVRPTGSIDGMYSKSIIEGGVFKNCWGRSIKTQNASTSVSNVDIYRDTGLNGGVGNVEIDSQYCVPTISNVNCYYDGNVPSAVIGAGANNNVKATTGYITDISVNGTGAETLPQVLQIFTIKGLKKVVISNVSTSDIEVDDAVSFYATDNESSVEVNNFDLSDVSSSLVLVRKGGSETSTATLGRVEVNNAVNRGAGSPNLVECRVSGVSVNAIVSTGSGGVNGFYQDPKSSTGTSNPPAVSRAGRFGNEATNTSYMRVETVNLGADETHTFEQHGFVSGCSIAMINSGIDKDVNGLITLSTSGAIAMFAGSSLSVGSTSEPAGGEVRAWASSGSLSIKNVTASSKVVTVYFF